MTTDKQEDEGETWATRRRAFATAELVRFRIATYSLIGLSLLAALTFAGAILGKIEPPQWEAVALLALAGLCAAFPLLSKLSVSKDGSAFDLANPMDVFDRFAEKAEAARTESFEQTRKQIGALSMQVSEALDDVTGQAKGGATAAAVAKDEPTLRDIRKMLPAPEHPDDPQRGRFGGKAKLGNRELTAATLPSDIGRNWRRVILTLSSTDKSPLQGQAAYFFLHDTFEPDAYRVPVKTGANSVRFEIAAIGAFTAGVVAERGETRRELDLTDASVDAPQDWKTR